MNEDELRAKRANYYRLRSGRCVCDRCQAFDRNAKLVDTWFDLLIGATWPKWQGRRSS